MELKLEVPWRTDPLPVKLPRRERYDEVLNKIREGSSVERRGDDVFVKDFFLEREIKFPT